MVRLLIILVTLINDHFIKMSFVTKVLITCPALSGVATLNVLMRIRKKTKTALLD